MDERSEHHTRRWWRRMLVALIPFWCVGILLMALFGTGFVVGMAFGILVAVFAVALDDCEEDA